jgi:cyclopropane fatty-acyl-phospholipid synthase-like methyltransferase
MDIYKKVSEYYTQKILTFGTTSQGVDWNGRESQFLRFEQLCKLLPPIADEPFSILDFGCGYGALIEYLKSKYISFSYTGYDISEEMINQAKKVFTDSHFNFTSSEKSLSNYDYVIASGIFNVKLDTDILEWEKYIFETLEKLNELSSKGFSFNILTSYSDKEFMKDYLYYADPCFFFDYCKKNFSKNIALLHDYNLYEFTIIVRK